MPCGVLPKRVFNTLCLQENFTPAKLHLIYQNNEKCKFFNAWKLSSEPAGRARYVTFERLAQLSKTAINHSYGIL
jgi:hypothetical protein